ncbi:MAG: hypothetical protein N3G48_07650 [Sulfolobales archaeon]|nr:hypothetical protein [Sulfolobales archaeon]
MSSQPHNTYIYYLLKTLDTLARCSSEFNVLCVLFNVVKLTKMCDCDNSVIEHIEKMYDNYIDRISNVFIQPHERDDETFSFIFNIFMYIMNGCVGKHIKNISTKSILKYEL